jgi:hypothetical protein
MNLFLKLVELRSQVEGFYKDTKSFGYSYVSGAQVLDKINPVMNELKLLFLPKSANHRGWAKHEYTNKKNEELLDFIVEGSLDYVWINAENPEETWEINWQYYGAQNDISKAFGSALTYSERYLLLKSLGLPTDEEDPDGRDTNGKAPIKKKPTSEKPTYGSLTSPVKENVVTPKEMSLEDKVKALKTQAYTLIVKTVATNIMSNDLDQNAKVEMAKRVVNDYIRKDLKLSFDKIELVNALGEKLISTNVEVLISDVIDKSVAKANQEIALLNANEEEI